MDSRRAIFSKIASVREPPTRQVRVVVKVRMLRERMSEAPMEVLGILSHGFREIASALRGQGQGGVDVLHLVRWTVPRLVPVGYVVLVQRELDKRLLSISESGPSEVAGITLTWGAAPDPAGALPQTPEFS